MLYKSLLLLMLGTLLSNAFADVLYLSNGDRISGRVTSIGGDSVTILPAYSSKVEVRLSDVLRLETEAATELELSDGTVGSFQISGGVEQGKARLVGADKAIDVALAEIQRFGSKPPRKNWDTTLDLSSNFSRGNTDSQDTNIQWRASYQRDEHRYKADLLFSREEKDGTKTKEKDRLKLGYNWLFSDSWFFAVDSKFERDPIAELDHRVAINPALGYDVWNEDDRTLNFQFGAGYASERTSGKDESGANIDWKLEFSHDLMGGEMEIFHNHNIYRNLGGRKNTVLNSQTGIRYDLLENLHLNAQLNYDYDTEPTGTTDNKDIVFMVGAGLNF